MDNEVKQKSDFKLPVKRVTGDTVEERLTENAHDRILPSRYLLKNKKGETIETPNELFERVAKNVAKPDQNYDDVDYEESWEEFFDLMSNLAFMPNSPTLMNAGADLQQLSACFVVHPEDDMDSIFSKVHDAAKIFQSGGGMGYPFHLMRPKGDIVGSTGGVSSGPMSFQQVFDTMCGTIKQGGCLSQDSRVMTSKGYIPLGEIHNGRPNSDAPAEALVKTREGFNQAVQTHESGKMDLHTVITEDGYKLKAVYEHPVLSVDQNGELEFKRVDKLEEGDTIVYDQSDKLFDVRESLNKVDKQYHHNVQTAEKLPSNMNDNLARFLGLLWADGTFDSSNDRLVFSLAKDRNEKDWLKETIELWGLTARVIDQEEKGKGDYWRVVIQSQHLMDWMKKNDLEKKIKEIPEPIYRSPKAIPSFLGGFTADATVAKDADTVSYSTSKIETAENLQELMLLCGIGSKITRIEPQENRKSDKESFRVRVNAGKSAHKFDQKVDHFLTEDFGTKGGQRQNKIHFADRLVKRLLNEKFEKNKKLPDDVDRKAMKELRRYERGDRIPSRQRLVEELEKVGITDVPLLDEDHLFQRVAYNEEDDNAPIADIEIMNGAHEFVASNAVVHNKRRGAQMGIMKVNHPDILRFVTSKRKEGNLSNFNISVGLTEDFMEAVKNDEEYTLTNPRTEEPFQVKEMTAEFYNNDEEWYPEATGSDQGKDDNFWRDFSASFGEEVQQYDIDLEVGEEMTLPARFIWECLIDGAWRNGEPGLFMYDEANEMHSFDTEKHPEHRIEATNPCVTGDTHISTDQGVFTAEELYNQKIATDVIVDSRRSSEKVKEASSVYKTGTKDVFNLETFEGFELRLTADHQVMTQDGWTEAQNLEKEDEIHILDREGSFGHGGTEEEGKVLGWLVGDGQMKNSEERAVLHFYDKDTEISEEFAGYANKVVRSANGNGDYQIGVQQIQRREGHRKAEEAKEERVRSARLYELASEYNLNEDKLQVPQKIFRSSKAMASGFLQGLFTADGSVQGNVEKGVSVRLSSSNEDLLKDTQQLLLNFGIYSKVYTERRKEGKREMPDGKGGLKEYEFKAQHELMISKKSLEKFQEEIGFLREDKNRKLEEKLSKYTKGPYREKFTARVKSLEKDGKEDVYDLTEPDTHSFIANGLVVHNCGEQPLENYEACNLGHINLSVLVDDKGQGKALSFAEWKEQNSDRYDFDDQADLEAAMREYIPEAMDMERFEYTAKTGTRFLDNVVTMSDFPLEEIEETVDSLRKIGLGLMGYAQMLIQLGIRYGSDESVAAAKEIQRLITRFSIEESNRLAEVRGEFPEWEKSKWASPTEHEEWFNSYTGGLDAEDFEDGLKLRNHNTTTIAPTGTTSMIGNTSGGCEPIFSLAYFKNVAKDIQGEDMLVEFDDYFIRALEANDVDVEEVKEAAQEKMENNEWEGVESIPDEVLPSHVKEIFATANQVSPEEHIDIQAAFQAHNHSGISKTCNFPNSATKDDVREAYMRAYDKGVKGMTVYRDGTRETQVMQTNKENTLTDMDKVDMLSEIVDEFGGPQDLLQSNEFEEVVSQTGLEIQDEDTEELSKEVTQEGVEAESPQEGESTKMGDSKNVKERPKVAQGTTQEIETAYGDLFVTINNSENNGPFEVFANLGKSGGYTQSFTQALGRMTSLALRSGAEGEDVIKQLDDIRSPQIAWDQGTQIHSVPDAIAEAMKRHMQVRLGNQQTVDQYETQGETSEQGKKQPKTDQEQTADAASIVQDGENPECPECGGMLVLQEGCNKCPSCGYSKC